jgi:hypothetical protein
MLLPGIRIQKPGWANIRVKQISSAASSRTSSPFCNEVERRGRKHQEAEANDTFT